ncbi:MAG: hypothetical protein EOM28_12935 [Clostridia bacterium]|nr:hypothetical protein [Clostridia bacterium]
MIFFPTESLILGLFIMAASLLFAYFQNDLDSYYFKRKSKLAKRLGLLCFIAAIALGVSSSLMPIS